MKLYYSPGTCSLAPDIVMHELALKFDMVKVDLQSKQTNEGDYRQVNPKGYVPAIQLDSGEVLTEVAVMLQYLSDQNPQKNLFPRFGSMERYHAMEWLNFVATELHKGIGTLFNPALTDDAKKALTEKLGGRFKVFDAHVQKSEWILGSQFSIVDAYAFTVLRWTHYVKIDLSAYKGILGFMERVQNRPAVVAAIEAEKGKKLESK
jgi:glutathione S-transferase